MPEGPEIRLAADEIARVLEGQTLVKVILSPPALKAFEAELLGAKVEKVETCGKAMLTHFNNGLTLYSHNQLYGRWYTRPAAVMPRTQRQLRVLLETHSHRALLYSATDIEMLDSSELASHPFLRRIGPDILNPDLTWQTVASRLAEKRFRGRSLATLYLDQGFLAGNGNYLRSEILHFAGLHYARKPKDLTRAERQRLARHTLTVAWRSYRTAGIANSSARVKARESVGITSRRDTRFAVFARVGKSCDVCEDKILRTEAGGRRVYFCPTCQGLP